MQVDSPLNLSNFITEQKPEEVFIIDKTAANNLENLLLTLYRKDAYIRIQPELYQTINIPIKLTDLLNSPLLLLSKDLISPWQQSVKTLADIILSFLAVLLLLPLVLVLTILIKATSKGPVIYSHQRIGKNGRPFKILKFRSMYVDSEPSGPQLTTKNDSRVTPVGRFMRKRRLDEIPNFINVFKGDMSLVGPRPERQFFIDQIVAKAPQYSKLHLVKPGLTSWGQVKFGYAESIDEMIQRMRYDLVYIENMSLYVDFQILLKTIKIIIKGEGI
jgi:exopolysaccharide biosynthesis polyprenyl glycosylphosphotransferase